MSNDVTRYIAYNKIIVIPCAYLIISSSLKALTAIDICIPCIWQSIFGIHCPGCGLTTAFISMIEFDFKKALEINWLIFIIIPFGIYYITQDYVKFQRKHNA